MCRVSIIINNLYLHSYYTIQVYHYVNIYCNTIISLFKGGDGGKVEPEGTTNESSRLVGGDGGQKEGRRKLREPPMSREDLSVVMEGRQRLRKGDT